MACGDKYREMMMRTATGRTPDDPCTLPPLFCLPGEYDSWHRAAERVAQEVKARWDSLSRAESKSGDTRFSQAVGGRVGEYQKGFAALPDKSWYDIFTSDQTLIEATIGNMEEGICVMEILDGAIKDAGGDPIETAGRGDDDGWPWGWMLAGAAAMAGGYYIARRWAREERMMTE